MIVDDSQMFGGLIANNYGLLPRDSRVFGSHGGFVGCGLPIAVGVAAAHREEVVVCTLGDQGFTNSLQALAVAGEQQVSLLIVVCNNGSSVSLRKQAKHDGLQFSNHPFLENNECMSYAAVARGFGLSSSVFVWPGISEHIQTSIDAGAGLAKKISEAISTRKPHLLELIVPGELSFWEGVWNVEGLEGLSALVKQPNDGASQLAA
jgi:acetolactate synthase-1/2/3 large subunit